MVHLNPSDSLALQKIIIQMTYSESWLGSCEFGLHPKHKHPEQERPTFLISVPNLSGSCETQRGKGRGISSRFRRMGLGWANRQALGEQSLLSGTPRLAPAVGRSRRGAGGGIVLE